MGDDPLYQWSVHMPSATLVSLNNMPQNWRSRQATKGLWMQAGWALGTQLRAAVGHRTLPFPVSLQFVADMTKARRRDGHNFAPTAKWLIDGVVLSKLLKDDSTEHLTLLDWEFPTVKARPMLTMKIWRRE